MTKIRLENVSYAYEDRGAALPAVEGINISVHEGEFVSIIGPSGCGKSTLLSLLAGLSFPSAGCIFIDGQVIKGTGPDRGLVFQHYSLFPWMTARQNIVFGIRQVKKSTGKKTIEKIADEYLGLVGLRDFAHKYPLQLSGGMQQRVAIARAFAMNPRVLLMDEPFGALDAKNRVVLQEVLLKLWDNGSEKKTVIFVTHDIDEAVLLSDRIMVMSARPGTVVREVPVEFARPRDRAALIGSEEYAGLRNKMVSLFYDDVLQKIGGSEVAL
ncbi:MAG: ABC transporter ATP-binding protein [Firmicutes bacterium HGW-Firmicutes-14]|nr:MAG: ABC transporter ATP-binding protein [Firmicutes bacterium HGW-Firmicutes-14]